MQSDNKETKELTDKFLHLRYMHTLAEQYKTSIYSRSQMLLAVTGVEIAFTLTIANFAVLSQSDASFPIWFRVLIIVTISSQLISALMLIRTIIPHKSIRSVQSIIRKKTMYTSTTEISWLLSSFNHVAKKERDEFNALIDKMSLSDMYKDLTTNYYNLCHIINNRYTNLRHATILNITGIIVLLIEAIAAIILRK